MKKFFLFCLVLSLCACAKHAPVPMEKDAALLTSRWQAMEAARQPSPYRLQLSLRFGKEGDTRRVTGILWGNDTDRIRLDVDAGIGVTVAKIFADGNDFEVYAPRENRAYEHTGAAGPLLKIGVPVPFQLSQLAALLTGDYSGVFGRSYAEATLLSNGNASYQLDGAAEGVLEINEDNLPVSWRQKQSGWEMRISYGDNERAPQLVRLTNRNGARAIISIKSRESLTKPFDKQQLELNLPGEVPRLPLSKFRSA